MTPSQKFIQVAPRGNNTPNDLEENERESIVTPEKQTSRKQRYITITPRKQAKYVSPPKRIVTRKRKDNPDKWQKNLRKRLRQAGSENTDTKGKTVEAREMKDIDCNKCRFECSLNVDEDNRRRIFQDYWGLKSYDRQRDFICCRVLQGESNAKGGEKRTREVTRKYKFAVDGKSVRVCKKFFVATLGIGIKTVDYALKRKQATDNPIKDRRGKGTYHNKTPEVDIERIHAHIDSFPAMESLYARKDSNRKFLNNSVKCMTCM